MYKYVKEPTLTNLICTMQEDTLQRKQFLGRFIELLNAIDDGCAISLNGKWGSGKTFFVKQAELVLDAFNPHSSLGTKERSKVKSLFPSFISANINGSKSSSDIQSVPEIEIIPQYTIHYDAWEHDSDIDPLISIIFDLYSQIKNNVQQSSQLNEKAKLDRIGKLSTLSLKLLGKMGVKFLDAQIGINIEDFVNSKNLTDLIQCFTVSKDRALLQSAEDTQKLQEQINELLNSCIPDDGQYSRMVIFVDELDRCKPDYAVKLIERIKHYFNNPRLTFVFAINPGELIHTISAFYGQGFDSGEYLNRFFDFNLSLPIIDLDGYLKSLNIGDSKCLDAVIRALVIEEDLQLREILRAVSTIRLLSNNINKLNHFSPDQDLSYYMYMCNFILIPIIVILGINDSSKKDRFISGEAPEVLHDVLNYMGIAGRTLCEELLAKDEVFKQPGMHWSSSSQKKEIDFDEWIDHFYKDVFKKRIKAEDRDFSQMQIDIGWRILSYVVSCSALLTDFSDFKAIEKKYE